MNLRKLAEGRDCQIRVPMVCCGHTETVVLCHVRMIGISGFNLKANDALAAWGCQPCHDYVDGRAKATHTYEERRAMLLEGMARTQYILISEGKIRT
jgi:hypothetical protein